MQKPSHFLVVRSPFAEALVLGIKSFEWRSWGDKLRGKTVAIAVARSKCPAGAIQDEIDIWEPSKAQIKKLENLADGRALGKIIGQVTFGDCLEQDGEKAVFVEKHLLYRKENWLFSPGGLGLHPIV